jgi:hypothetical protein
MNFPHSDVLLHFINFDEKPKDILAAAIQFRSEACDGLFETLGIFGAILAAHSEDFIQGCGGQIQCPGQKTAGIAVLLQQALIPGIVSGFQPVETLFVAGKFRLHGIPFRLQLLSGLRSATAILDVLREHHNQQQIEQRRKL